jgi:hypothetical protein
MKFCVQFNTRLIMTSRVDSRLAWEGDRYVTSKVDKILLYINRRSILSQPNTLAWRADEPLRSCPNTQLATLSVCKWLVL